MPRGIRGSNPIPVLSPKQHLEFESFIESSEFKLRLRNLTNWRSLRAARAQAHPYLERDDLRSIATMAAYETFARYVSSDAPAGKPRTNTTMLRLVVQAMRWALLNEYKRAIRHGGDDNVVTASLDAANSGAGFEYNTSEHDGSGQKKVGRAFGSGDSSEDQDGLEVDGLHEQVSALCGEPDPLTMLLIKERLEAI
jgi:hypothetical protein